MLELWWLWLLLWYGAAGVVVRQVPRGWLPEHALKSYPDEAWYRACMWFLSPGLLPVIVVFAVYIATAIALTPKRKPDDDRGGNPTGPGPGEPGGGGGDGGG